MILHQVERRFGPIEPEVADRIRSLSSNQLEGLGDALLEFNDSADLPKWLDSRC